MGRAGTYNRRFYDLLQHFHGTSWNVAREDPTAHASMYVPTVALTRLLANPRWKTSRSASRTTPHSSPKYAAPSYTWHPYPYHHYIEPLARTLFRERERRDFETGAPEAPRTYYVPRAFLPQPGEVIESGELCQDGWDE